MADPGAARKADPNVDWRPGERELRERELKGQRRAHLAQAATAIAAFIAALAAAYASLQAGEAVKIAQDGIQRQVDETRLSTAVAAIGGELPAERVAGFTLLRRHSVGLVDRAAEKDSTERERDDALSLYKTSLDILENYLKNPAIPIAIGGDTNGKALAVPGDSKSGNDPVANKGDTKKRAPLTGLGFGRPLRPSDSVYAANELRELLELRRDIRRVGKGEDMPSIDLTRVQLYGQSWAGIDFSWLLGHYFHGIDLRGTTLSNSRWGGSWLGGAYLQCADLSNANFVGTTLAEADLRGANLGGARFADADLEGADLKGVVGLEKAVGLDQASGFDPPRAEELGKTYDRTECLAKEAYWFPDED